MSIGETLSGARERAGLTVAQVSRTTRIRETVIEAIERDDFSLSGGDFYARGHIRSIAHVVGVDDVPLVAEYDERHGGGLRPTSVAQAFEPETPIRIGGRRRTNWSLAMVIALVIVAAFVAVRVARGGDHDGGPSAHSSGAGVSSGHSPSAGGPSASPSTSPSPTHAAPKHSDKVKLELKASEPAWVKVTDHHGSELYSGLMEPDMVKHWTAKHEINLVLGNAGGVDVIVNGKDLGAPGDDGHVITLSFGPGDPAAT